MNTLALTIGTPPTLALTISEGGSASLALTIGPALEIPLTVSGGGSSGDMRKAVYDPDGIEADVFDLSNHSGTLNHPAVIIDGGQI